MAEFKKELCDKATKQLVEATSSIQTTTDALVASLLRKFDHAAQTRFAAVETSVGSLKARTLALETDNKNIKSQIASITTALHAAEAVVAPPPPPPQEWGRPPDPAILRLNTQPLVCKTDLAATVASWLHPHFKPTDFRINGEETIANRFFSIQFMGAPGLAASRASKALGTLKAANGQWAPPMLVKEADGSTDTNLYISADKNSKQLRTEACGKKLFKVFEQVHPRAGYQLIKRQGLVKHRAAPIARAVPSHDGTCEIEWNSAHTNDDAIDHDEVTRIFRAEVQTPAVSWTTI